MTPSSGEPWSLGPHLVGFSDKLAYQGTHAYIVKCYSSIIAENYNILADIFTLKKDDWNLLSHSGISHVQSLLCQGLLVCDFSQQNSDMIHCTSLDQNHLFLKFPAFFGSLQFRRAWEAFARRSLS